MTSLRMKMYRFCGVFMLFFLEIKSEITIPPVTSVQTPGREASPHTPAPAVVELKNMKTTASYVQDRTASAKPFTLSVSGSERPTHKETSALVTTVKEHEVIISAEKTTAPPKSDSSTSLKATALTTSTKAPVLTSAQQPASDSSTVAVREMTTVLPTPDPQTTGVTTTTTNSTAKITPTNDSGRASTTSAMTESSTSLASEKSTGLATTTSVKQTTPPITTVKYDQNITKGELIQSSATTTAGSGLVNHTENTENTKNVSTTGSPIENQSTTGSHSRTPAPTHGSTTAAETTATNGSIFMTTNATHGALIPVVTKILPTSTPSPTTVVTTQNTTVTPCSSLTTAKHCLIVIAALATVATVFMVSTIVLCTKLSARKYRLKRQQRGTEMMCISSLLPERSNHQPVRYTRQRNPVPNGVLVIHNYDDSDDDTGDNLTLSSFLPENDRYV